MNADALRLLSLKPEPVRQAFPPIKVNVVKDGLDSDRLVAIRRAQLNDDLCRLVGGGLFDCDARNGHGEHAGAREHGLRVRTPQVAGRRILATDIPHAVRLKGWILDSTRGGPTRQDTLQRWWGNATWAVPRGVM